MRRGGALFVLAVMAAAVFVAASGRSPEQAHAAGGTCLEGTKRVVKHVKRHGKRTRIVRSRHYRTCDEAPAPSAPPAASPASAAASPSAPSPTPPPTPLAVPVIEAPAQPEPEANALGVAAEDNEGLRFSLTRQNVRPGLLVIQLTNKGEDPHTMDMQRIGPNGQPEGPVIADLAAEPGEPSTQATVEVQPGAYRMWCTIGHHAEHGMSTEVKVE